MILWNIKLEMRKWEVEQRIGQYHLEIAGPTLQSGVPLNIQKTPFDHWIEFENTYMTIEDVHKFISDAFMHSDRSKYLLSASIY